MCDIINQNEKGVYVMILLNKNMPAEVFDILVRAAERVLSVRKVGLGDGFAVEPENGNIYAPAAGKIVSISESRHAYSIAADFGDLLVHIGIDTIGVPEAFLPIAMVGDYVAAGQPIARADLDMIKKAGLSPVIPVLITDLRAAGTVKKNYGKARGGKDVAMYLTH